jgi:CubicO group peptidase (beta-lactamase class C family)
MLRVHGWVARGFEDVREAFAANFEHHADVGAACAVYRHGKPVVDLWAGFADLEAGRPWEEGTIQLVFSATKGLTATCVHLLAERRALDLDAPVAIYWPEFAAGGKESISLRWVLCHKAGLAAVDGDLSLEQVLAWDPVVAAIARQTPNWDPGTAHGYHVRSFGWILGEIVRRVTGRSLGRFLADEIARPFGLDLFVGAPRLVLRRCARVIPPGDGLTSMADLLGPDALTTRAMTGPSGLFAYDEMWNRPELLVAEMPSSNGVGSARALARFYAALVDEVDGMRLLQPVTVDAACEVHASGADRVILLPSCFGAGFALPPMMPGTGPRSFGHPGAGGSLGFADRDARLGFGYVTTRMKFDPAGDARTRALLAAVYRSLGWSHAA